MMHRRQQRKRRRLRRGDDIDLAQNIILRRRAVGITANSKPSVDRRSGFMHDAEAHDILSPKVYVTYIHTQEAFYEGTMGAGGTRSILRGRQGTGGT